MDKLEVKFTQLDIDTAVINALEHAAEKIRKLSESIKMGIDNNYGI